MVPLAPTSPPQATAGAAVIASAMVAPTKGSAHRAPRTFQFGTWRFDI
jgi:hypothetical protein